MKSFRMTVVLIGMMAMGAGGLSAQVRPGGPPPNMRQQRQERMRLEQRLQQGFGVMVRNQLGLDEEELAAVQAVMQSFRDDRQALSQDQGALRRALRNPAEGEMADDEARSVLAEMVRLQESELELYRREQQELLTVLSPGQLVKFYGLREEWGLRIQQLRQGGGPGGIGMTGGIMMGGPVDGMVAGPAMGTLEERWGKGEIMDWGELPLRIR